MGRMRIAVLAAVAFKAMVVVVWLCRGLAGAEPTAADAGRPGGPPGEAIDPGVSSDLFRKSRGFRELLEAVRQRGLELDRRERELAAREVALRALEETLADAVARAETAPPPVAQPGGAGEHAGCSPGVTKVYASMRAEDAAPILDRLDDETASKIFGCMKEKQIGAILAAMSRDRAVALTRSLAGTRTAVAE